MKPDGTLWVLSGDKSPRRTGAQTGSGDDWTQAWLFNGYYAMKTDGSVWKWQKNSEGKNEWTRWAPEDGWADLAISDHTAAVKRDGTLWTWGSNDCGQLGNGKRGPSFDRSYYNTTTPQPVAGSDWAAAQVGVGFTLALKRDGSLWSWGLLSSDLGEMSVELGSCDVRPTRVGTSSNWVAFATEAKRLGFGLKADGSLWNLGENRRAKQTRVGTDNDWAAVSAGLALKADGTLWALDTNNVAAPPERVGEDADWIAVEGSAWRYAAGNGQKKRNTNGVAMKRDGSLWKLTTLEGEWATRQETNNPWWKDKDPGDWYTAVPLGDAEGGQ